VFEVGLIECCEPPEPAELEKPEGLPLASCYRLNPNLVGRNDKDGRDDWRAITISRERSVSVALADGSTKTILPPAGTLPPVSAA
jgi:hypothetical protein